MTGLVRKATLLSVCGLLIAGVAMAHVADPANSECNNLGAVSLGSVCPGKAYVYVVGSSGGVPDVVGQFCITVRDFNNVPIENSVVVVDLSNCDVKLCADQKDLDPTFSVDCTSSTVRKATNASGVACFKILGKGLGNFGTLGCVALPKNCATITADGHVICTGDAPTFDLIGQPSGPGLENGLNPNDLSEFIQQWLVCGVNNPRCNYECSNQALDPNDLSYFIEVWLVRGNSPSNCGSG